MTWVLLPGLDGTGRLFAPLLEVLEQPAQVVSYPTAEVADYDALTERVSRDLPEDSVIVAESFSGPIGIRLAPRARALVLVATFATAPLPLLRAWDICGGVFSRFSAPKAALRYLLLDADASPDLVDKLASAVRSLSAPVLRQRVRDVLLCDERERLAAASTPVLYLRATRDRVVPGSAADPIRDARPDADIVDIDSPHLLLQSRPAAAKRVIIDFLEALETAP